MWAFLFGLTLLSFVPSWARRFAWHDFLPDWPIGLSFISFFLSRGFMAYLLLSCFVPLIVLVGLLAAISYLDGSLCFISFFLSSSGFYGTFVSILLCFYLLLCLWACLLPFLAMLAHWALFISFFFGLLWPIYFYLLFNPSLLHFLLVVGPFYCWTLFNKNRYQHSFATFF